MPRARAISLVCLSVAAAVLVPAGSGQADLMSRYESGQDQASQLRSRIQGETHQIQGFEGTVGSLEGRLTVVQRSVDLQQRLLNAVTTQLRQDQSRLGTLRADYTYDIQTLAAQLRADYESPPPTLMNVVVDADGFDSLINGLSDVAAIERRNVTTTRDVAAARVAVQAQSVRLAKVQVRRRRATAAVVTERDTLAQLRLSIVDRELRVERARSQDSSRLDALHRTLVREANVLDAEAARAQTLSSGGAVAPPGGCVNTPFVPHGGEYGFFPAPGTNYTVNQEPVIAARLDALGKALQLHLIGISGYRTPQHSVEVGGFADDPHTRGEASDTPGVEGVPEATLEEFCLTRPFPGPREADHIQES